ncbi:hypothetical protein ABW19_dt0202578 [Dactylella cylindrospora]|nr:hypothetical protein ABW19_dt0202578 [Dactylella cylindrospora]
MDNILRPLLRPPQKYSIFKSESKYLGIFAYSVDVVDGLFWDTSGLDYFWPWEEYCSTRVYASGNLQEPADYDFDENGEDISPITRLGGRIFRESIIKIRPRRVRPGRVSPDIKVVSFDLAGNNILSPGDFEEEQIAISGNDDGPGPPGIVIRHEYVAAGLPHLSSLKGEQFTYSSPFFNYANPGKGVTIYISDSTVDESHPVNNMHTLRLGFAARTLTNFRGLLSLRNSVELRSKTGYSLAAALLKEARTPVSITEQESLAR